MNAPENKARDWGPLVRALGAMALVAAIAVFWRPLVAWFTGQPAEKSTPASAPASTAAAPAAPDHAGHTAGEPANQAARAASLPRVTLDAAAFEYVSAAFQAYEAARALLARDSIDGLAARTKELSAALGAAADTLRASHADIAAHLGHSAEIASRLGAAPDLRVARQHFSALSQSLIALAEADPRLQEGWHVFECPMQGGFNRWFQRAPDLANPYMGPQMLACGGGTAWSAGASAETGHTSGHASGATSEHAPGDISHYTCSMHPSVRQAGPGQCPICGMTLTPVTYEEIASGVIRIDDARRRRIGLETAPVVRAPLGRSIRALGRVTYDETALVDVTLKLDGYIEKLHVETTGQPVRLGQVLFTLYSPELYAAQQELLLAQQSTSQASQGLARAARKRLELWGLSPAQVERIATSGEPLQSVPFLAPASGYVIEKDVVQGAAVQAGQRLFRIAPLSRVWVQADVYEQDLPYVKVGQKAEITFPYLPGKKYENRIAYIYPALEGMTRTARVRIELPNQELALKPDMYADVRLHIDAGERLQVPDSAVIYTGPRRLVFVDLGDGRLEPREVTLGLHAEDAYEVLDGLSEGERVVTGGNFLIAAESRIRSAADYWSGGAHAGH